MAVTKTLIRAVPYEKDGKVSMWDFEYLYENDSEGDATYGSSTFHYTVETIGRNGIVMFTPKAKADWTKSEIEALCPFSRWDAIFANQVDSIITNPVNNSFVPDTDYSMPE